MVINKRTYSAIDDRSTFTSAFTEDDLTRIMNLSASKGQGCNIMLACNINLTKTIVVPSLLSRLQINGGNAFGFRFVADLENAIDVRGTTELLLQDLSFAAGNTVATSSKTATNLLTTPTDLAGLRIRGVSIDNCVELWDPTKKWSGASIIQCDFASVNISGNFRFCDFINCLGSCSVVAGSLSFGSRFMGVNTPGLSGTSADTTGSALNVPYVFIGCGFGTMTVRDQDIVLAPISISPDPINYNQFNTGNVQLMKTLITSTPPTSTTLNSAGPTLVIASTYIRIALGASCSGNLTLGDGDYDGQDLTIFCSLATGSLTLPNSAANNVRLNTAAGALAFTLRDTIVLKWDASDNNWIEITRSLNS